jgi:hypothetical protein
MRLLLTRSKYPAFAGWAAAALLSRHFPGGVLAQTSGSAQKDLPACPKIALDDVRVLAEPCSDPMMACDLDAGCIGAVVNYVGERIDLSEFTEPPPPEYVADCVAPFALSEEVTSVIPQETLGAMIGCDFDAVTARFESDFAPRGESIAPESAPAPAPAYGW